MTEISSKKRTLSLQVDAIAETLQESLLILGADLKVLFANKAFYETFRVSKDETVGFEIYSLGNGQWNIPELKLLLAEILPSQIMVSNYEMSHKFPDIGVKTMLLNAKKLEEENSPEAILLAIEDVTDKREKAYELSVSEVRYRKLFEKAQDGIFLVDPITERIIDANPFMLEMMDYDLDEVIGKKLWEVGAIKDIRANVEMFSELQTKGYVRYESLPIKSKDGKEHEVEFVSNLYPIDGTKMIQCNIRDISERKLLERQLAVTKYREDALLASIGEGIVGTDEQGNIISMNVVAKEMLGWTTKEVMGQKLFDIIVVEDEQGNVISRSQRPTLEVFKTGVPEVSSTFYIAKDKEKIPVAINLTPILLDGKTIGTVNVFRDITKEMELKKAREEFVSLTTHQLRAPITAIKWTTEMLVAHKYASKDEEDGAFQTITKAAESLSELVNAMLNIAKMESGVLAVTPELSSLPDLADEVLKEVSEQMMQKKLILEKTFDETLPKILVDQKLTIAIFKNLLSNAVKYTLEGGKIHFSIVKQDSDVLMMVSDTGIGIPKAQQSKLFSKFFRADNVKEGQAEGTGLGLYIVKLIVDQVGGKIWFESEENKGTTFFVTIPLSGMVKKEGVKSFA